MEHVVHLEGEPFLENIDQGQDFGIELQIKRCMHDALKAYYKHIYTYVS